MRLTIVGDKSIPIILTITVAILFHDEASHLDYASCHATSHITEAFILEIVANQPSSSILWDLVARLAALGRS